MKSFVVAHILDSYKVGDRFTTWPLHVTILPPFEAESLQEVVHTLAPVIEQTAPIHAQLGDFAQFGAKTTVQKVIINPELQALHDKLLAAGEAAGFIIASKYTGRYLTPHVTRKKGRDFDGTEFVIKKVAIAESEGLGYRKIVNELHLKGVVQ